MRPWSLLERAGWWVRWQFFQVNMWMAKWDAKFQRRYRRI